MQLAYGAPPCAVQGSRKEAKNSQRHAAESGLPKFLGVSGYNMTRAHHFLTKLVWGVGGSLTSNISLTRAQSIVLPEEVLLLILWLLLPRSGKLSMFHTRCFRYESWFLLP